MTKKDFEFAQEDLTMARRAAWLVSHDELSTKADKPRDVLGPLLRALEDSTTPIGTWKTLIAKFGIERWRDAQLGQQDEARRAIAKPPDKIDRAARHRISADISSIALSNKAIAPLSRVEAILVDVVKTLKAASRANAANVRELEAATGIKQRIPYRDAAVALRRVRLCLVCIGHPSGGGTRWLGKRAREAALSVEFMDLHEGGVPYAQLAFLAGYPPESCVVHGSGWENMRQRVKRAKKQRCL